MDNQWDADFCWGDLALGDRADVCPITMSCFANESIWPIHFAPTPSNFSFSLPSWAPAMTVMDTVFPEAEERGQRKCPGPRRCRSVGWGAARMRGASGSK